MAQSENSAPEASNDVSADKKSNTPLIIGIVLLVVILLLCGGCASVGFFSKSIFGDRIREAVSENISEEIFEEIIEEGLEDSNGEVDVDISDDTFTWESEEGSGSMGEVTEWPDDIPNSIPEFTYGDIDSLFALEGVGGSGWSMTFDNIENDAVDSYHDDLESDGWEISGALTTGSLKMFSAEKDDYAITCSCDSGEDACTVILSEDVSGN